MNTSICANAIHFQAILAYRTMQTRKIPPRKKSSCFGPKNHKGGGFGQRSPRSWCRKAFQAGREVFPVRSSLTFQTTEESPEKGPERQPEGRGHKQCARCCSVLLDMQRSGVLMSLGSLQANREA